MNKMADKGDKERLDAVWQSALDEHFRRYDSETDYQDSAREAIQAAILAVGFTLEERAADRTSQEWIAVRHAFHGALVMDYDEQGFNGCLGHDEEPFIGACEMAADAVARGLITQDPETGEQA